MKTPGAGTSTRGDALDDDAMRAYREYMLHGSKAKSSEERKSKNVVSSPMDRSSPRATWNKGAAVPAASPASSRTQKQLRLLHKSFRDAVRDWVETDDQLLQVVKSIANLRDRIFVASRALSSSERRHQEGGGPRDNDGWKTHGYRPMASPSSSSSQPPESVLRLALSDGLIQHEKMLALLRQLMSQQSQNQDAMGRRLDDLFVQSAVEEEHVETGSHPSLSWKSGGREVNSHKDEGTDAVQDCVDVHAACARELYRKQLIVQRLLDSTSNAMLYAHDAGIDEGENGNESKNGDTQVGSIVLARDREPPNNSVARQEHHHPRNVANRCARCWPRESESSELFAVRDKLVAELAL